MSFGGVAWPQWDAAQQPWLAIEASSQPLSLITKGATAISGIRKSAGDRIFAPHFLRFL